MSIFRYPGGKRRILKSLRPHLDAALEGASAFHDVFVGGGSVLLDVAARYPDVRLHANDLDDWMHAFYTVLISTDSAEQHAFRVLLRQKPTIDLFNKLRETEPQNVVEKAYYAVFFNRTTFSGIFSSGRIGGYEQKSKWTVDCRYNGERLEREFVELRNLMYGRLTVTQVDAIAYLERFGNDDDAFYLDPPYYEKGNQLYRHSMTHEDHVALSQAVKRLKRWILSYDQHPEVREMYSWANCLDLKARYSITGEGRKGWEGKSELVILPSHIACKSVKEMT